MTKSTRKDFSQAALSVLQQATGEKPKPEPLTGRKASSAKSGKKGGAARAASLTPEQRSEIAQLAANARWKKSDPS